VIPGKQYKPEDILEAAWRRRWFIVLPLVVVSALTIAIAHSLPDRYRSEAVLQIVPQRVPENFVRPTVTTRLDERLTAISQQLLSRTQLERIIEKFDLYPEERKKQPMEDVVERMRRDDFHITVAGTSNGDGGSFTVSYESNNPRTAMLVTEELAGLFITANMQDRAQFAEQTDQFLHGQLDDARRALMEHEKKLEAFRRANSGRLPSESESNQQAMLNTQMQLQALQESINRDRDRQTFLNRMIADLAAQANAAPTSTDPSTPMTATQQLQVARTNLRNMEARLKPTHPDIKAMKRSIADLEKKAAAEAAEQPMSASGTPTVNPADTARASRMSEYQAEVATIDRRLASKQAEEKQLMTAMASYRSRLEAAPGLESQLTELMRDYTTMQANYQNLLTKSQEAKIASNLEQQQIGEQFRIIDSARLPRRPTSPDRLRINLVGTFAGLAIGLGLAALLEYRDRSLRTEDDVVAALSLPVVALVPTMTTASERKRKRRQRLIMASSGAITLVLCLALVTWKLNLIGEWIR
jgi:protein tyrosine kinase modulator